MQCTPALLLPNVNWLMALSTRVLGERLVAKTVLASENAPHDFRHRLMMANFPRSESVSARSLTVTYLSLEAPTLIYVRDREIYCARRGQRQMTGVLPTLNVDDIAIDERDFRALLRSYFPTAAG